MSDHVTESPKNANQSDVSPGLDSFLKNPGKLPPRVDQAAASGQTIDNPKTGDLYSSQSRQPQQFVAGSALETYTDQAGHTYVKAKDGYHELFPAKVVAQPATASSFDATGTQGKQQNAQGDVNSTGMPPTAPEHIKPANVQGDNTGYPAAQPAPQGRYHWDGTRWINDDINQVSRPVLPGQRPINPQYAPYSQVLPEQQSINPQYVPYSQVLPEQQSINPQYAPYSQVPPEQQSNNPQCAQKHRGPGFLAGVEEGLESGGMGMGIGMVGMGYHPGRYYSPRQAYNYRYGMPYYGVPGYGVPGYGVPGYGVPGYGVPVMGAPGDDRYGSVNGQPCQSEAEAAGRIAGRAGKAALAIGLMELLQHFANKGGGGRFGGGGLRNVFGGFAF